MWLLPIYREHILLSIIYFGYNERNYDELYSALPNYLFHNLIARIVPKVKQNNNDFEIYSTVDAEGNRGLVQVSDPLHQMILQRLSKGEMSTTEISDLTGKAQSTLSVHLDQMVSQNLIRSEYDKNDSRRKIFTISSIKVASSKPISHDAVEEAKQALALAVKDNKTFYKTLFRSVLMSAEANGMDVSPMMEILGSQMADKMAQKLQSAKMEDVIQELQEFYERNDMGEVCVYTFLPLTIIIRETEEYQYKFEAMASFAHGLFKSLLSKVLGRKYEITMSEIFGSGNNYYKFIIEQA